MGDHTFYDPWTHGYDASREADAWFWESRDVLRHIRDSARARSVGPKAVLLNLLALVVAHVEPNVQLPALVGGRASLNLFVGIASGSAGGKGASLVAARECITFGEDHITTTSPGSGEGLAHMFARRDKDGKLLQFNTRALLVASEVSSMTALGQRSGQTLIPELTKAWSGEALGFQNANSAKTITLDPHGNRLCFLLQAQPELIKPMLSEDMVASGFPQRFLWAPASDPGAPRHEHEMPDIPEPWKWLGLGSIRDGVITIGVPDEIRGPIRRARLDRLAIDDLDPGGFPLDDVLRAHESLLQLKTAAALALLEGRTEIDGEDWSLAAKIIADSVEVLGKVRRKIREAEDGKSKARARAEAVSEIERDEHRETERLARAKDRILRLLRREKMRGDGEGWVSSGPLRSMLTENQRPAYDRALLELQAEKLIDWAPIPSAEGKILGAQVRVTGEG